MDLKNPRNPIYIVSKGRADSRLTSRTLEEMGVPYFIVIEEQEFPQYSSVINSKKILVLDKAYQREYDAFWRLSPEQSRGSGPARNFSGDHSRSLGSKYHWCVDDNIKYFFRLNNNLKVPVKDGTIFQCMEDFVERYKNIGMAGPNYFMFASRKSSMSPFTLNTRIYSCNLIRNDIPLRWRGRYNEDTDLSLRMLKSGYCTVLFNAFLQGKSPTLKMRGGNTDEIYKGGTLDKSKMLVDMHPDVARLAWRYGRAHHHVDYRKFKNLKLIRNREVEIKSGIDNYGLELQFL